MLPSYNSDWAILGSAFIRNVTLQEGAGLFPLKEGCLLAGCPYGGPIAIAIPSPTATKQQQPSSWRIHLSTANGSMLGCPIEASEVHSLRWSLCQKLIVMSSSGRVLLYSPLGQLLHSFSMGTEVQESGVAQTRIFITSERETGLAVLNKAGRVFAVNSINSRVLWRIREPERGRMGRPTCWAVIASPLKPTAVLLCSNTTFHLGILETAAQPCSFDWALTEGAYVWMEPSADYSRLALLHDSGVVHIVGGDLSSRLHTLNFNYQQHSLVPSKELLMWCGSDALAYYGGSGKALHLLGLEEGEGGDASASYTINFRSPIHCQVEVDGVRVFTEEAVNWVGPVPNSLRLVFGLASNAPGALLFEASFKLEKGDYTFYDCIREIRSDDGEGDRMAEAIEQCRDAAAHHFDPQVQKALLSACQMGMALCERDHQRGSSHQFVEVARLLRIGNAMRCPLGLPITHSQLCKLGVPQLVERLGALGHWPMAVELCRLMEYPPEEGEHKVLMGWCQSLMEALKAQGQAGGALSQERVAEKILSRLDGQPGISYADVADLAVRTDLQGLATLLLEREPNASRQVALLLKLKQVDRALTKAAQSQHPDLLHLVLRHLLKTSNSQDIELRLRKIPQALCLYQSQIREEAPDRALALYEQGDDFPRQAIHHLRKAATEASNAFMEPAKVASCLAKAERALAQLKDGPAAQMITNGSQLLADNAKREERLATTLVDKTLRQTFIWAVSMDDTATVEQLKRQHKLDEKQVWWWTLEGLAEGQRWQQLEQFGRAKRSPVGTNLPIIEICCRHKRVDIATRFMDTLKTYEEQTKGHIYAGEVKKAASLAAEKQDIQQLYAIRRKLVPSTADWQQISQMIRAQESAQP